MDTDDAGTGLVSNRFGAGQFSFAYDGVLDESRNPSHNTSLFKPGRLVAVEYQVHARNFRTRAKLDGAFDCDSASRGKYALQ